MSEGLSKRAKSQFWRRTFIRTVFAHIEGTIYGLKKLAVQQCEYRTINLSLGEAALLREEKYELDRDGKPIISQTNYPRFIANLRFTFYCAAKCCGTEYALDEKGIPDLKQFEKIRNKLTHPKKGEDLIVSDGDLKICLRAQAWFVNEATALFGKCDLERPTARQFIRRSTPKIQITEPYVVMLPHGNIYEFKKRRDAKVFAKNSWNGSQLTKPGFWHFTDSGKKTCKF